MSDPDRNDDFPGREDTFDIDIEGFDDLNFRESRSEYSLNENMDQELDSLIERLDKVMDETNDVDSEIKPPARRRPIPRPPAAARPSTELADDKLWPEEAIDGIWEQEPKLARANPAALSRPVPAARPEGRVEPVGRTVSPPADASAILLTDRLTDEDLKLDRAVSKATVAQLSPNELASLIERAVERGVLRALAAKKSG